MRFAAGAMRLMLSVCLAVATASVAEASTIVIKTDTTWLVKISEPGPGWNFVPVFNTAADGGWQAASNNTVPSSPCPEFGCMTWWDGQFSGTEQVYIRRTFVVDGPVVSADITGGIDDDAFIWVNGTLVYNVFDGLAGGFTVDLTSLLVPGTNLIAAFADDEFLNGHNHQFTARITIETASPTAVPEPSPMLLVASGLGLVMFATRRMRRRS